MNGLLLGVILFCCLDCVAGPCYQQGSFMFCHRSFSSRGRYLYRGVTEIRLDGFVLTTHNVQKIIGYLSKAVPDLHTIYFDDNYCPTLLRRFYRCVSQLAIVSVANETTATTAVWMNSSCSSIQNITTAAASTVATTAVRTVPLLQVVGETLFANSATGLGRALVPALVIVTVPLVVITIWCACKRRRLMRAVEVDVVLSSK